MRFEDLDPERFAGAALIVDVDGTLTHDAGDTVTSERAVALERLRASAASVTLVSNGSRERTRLLAEAHSVGFLDTRHRKPSRRVLETFSAAGSPVYMLGDKVLTDGLFAAHIGARFVPVSRIRHEDDTRATRATYLLDDLARPVMRLLMPVLPALTLMRPTQWIKNLLVFAPIFFAGDLRPGQLALAAAAFAIFSLAASVVYVINDLSDRATDRLHPSKRFRALASGAVGERAALALAIMLGALVAAGLLFLPALAWVVGAYLVGNALYSRGLKRVAVVDVSLVALFYVLRVVAGGVATATFVSPWIILCVFFGALFLALGKRRTEYISATKRMVREMYTRESIDLFVGLSAVLAIISYGIYSVLGAHSPWAVYSTVLVFRDRWALALTALWVVYMVALVVFP